MDNKDKLELSEKMANLPVDFITAVLRIIQIGQHNTGKVVRSLRSLCEDEIDFNDVPDDLVIELLDYLHMINVDRGRGRQWFKFWTINNPFSAEQVKRELESKAKFYGFDDAGKKSPL